jgi:D-tyrosyl-tRNA(Tyr) deacylase
LRAVVQRVAAGAVTVGAEEISRIGPGLVVLLGVTHPDGPAEADRMADKLLKLRVFEDVHGRMNEALGDREILCVSQFTLYADTRGGNRPGFKDAAPGEVAEPLYDRVCERLGAKKGRFGADMKVRIEADGPVTILVET